MLLNLLLCVCMLTLVATELLTRSAIRPRRARPVAPHVQCTLGATSAQALAGTTRKTCTTSVRKRIFHQQPTKMWVPLQGGVGPTHQPGDAEMSRRCLCNACGEDGMCIIMVAWPLLFCQDCRNWGQRRMWPDLLPSGMGTASGHGDKGAGKGPASGKGRDGKDQKGQVI